MYRSCLRWEFGFTCAFCLLHEALIAPEGAKGSARFWIEHLERQETHPDLAHDYDNVVYSCRRCNIARGKSPRCDADGRQLLDPCAQPWSEHFRIHGDCIESITADGEYTRNTYDINSPEKQRLRINQRETLVESLAILRDGPGLLRELSRDLDELPFERQQLRHKVMEQLHRNIKGARANLQRLHVIPADRDEACRCETNQEHRVPTWLHEQCLELPLT